MDRAPSAAQEVRAYSVLTVKAVDEEQRVIEGIANTPGTDRMGDVVDPKGAQFTLPLPLLWQHDKNHPIGHVVKAKATKDGIEIRATIAKGVLPYIDEKWALIKAGLVRGLSIGFRPIEFEAREGKDLGIEFKKWEWLELSAVTIPANADASIHLIKSIDDQLRAVSGAPRAVVHLEKPSPSVLGKSPTSSKGTGMKTTLERINDYEAKRAANAARMAAIMEKSNEDGTTLDQTEQDEYDGLVSEVKAIDDHIGRLKTLEAMNITKATPITPAAGTSPEAASQVRTGIISVKRNLAPGTTFARYAQALAMSKGNLMQAHQIAKQRWPDTPEVETVLRAAVNFGSTTDSDFAEPLVEYQTMASEFIDLLRPATILGKLTGLRRVPFNIRVAGKTSSSTVGWVGQGKPKPVGEVHFNETTLGFAKAAGIVVISQELARFSSPSAEALIRQDLVDTMAEFMDAQFITPSVAAVANVSPASITNGLTPVAATGTTLALITADVTSAFTKFINADLAPTKGVWVMKPVTALGLSLKRTSQDIFAFPDLTLTGGTWFGLPVIVSDAVPGTASGGTIIVLMDQSEIFYADDGQVRLDVSEQASLQLDSAPSDGAQSLVSLWQNNLIGIRAERFMNWARRRDAAVTYIDFVPTY